MYIWAIIEMFCIFPIQGNSLVKPKFPQMKSISPCEWLEVTFHVSSIFFISTSWLQVFGFKALANLCMNQQLLHYLLLVGVASIMPYLLNLKWDTINFQFLVCFGDIASITYILGIILYLYALGISARIPQFFIILKCILYLFQWNHCF